MRGPHRALNVNVWLMGEVPGGRTGLAGKLGAKKSGKRPAQEEQAEEGAGPVNRGLSSGAKTPRN